mmetsp:Transcript_18974/g.53150  ORF Transcript_18974/g.53150 Transcript_18974/m.53150 type:complete len:870 (+) Transcript_18974:214-2823(+)
MQVRASFGTGLILAIIACLSLKCVDAKVHCFVTQAHKLTHDHNHGRSIEKEQYGFYAARSNQTWNSDLGGYETVSPKFERCATFKVASLMTCEEWHADNRHICTKFGNEVDPQVGNLTGTVHIGYEEEEVPNLELAQLKVNKDLLHFGQGLDIDDMAVELEIAIDACSDDFCNDDGDDTTKMDDEMQLVLSGVGCYVTRLDDVMKHSHSHGKDIGVNEFHMYTAQKRPYAACVAVHLEHLADCNKWADGDEYTCTSVADAESNSGEDEHDHEHGGHESGHFVEGFIHVGYHHDPTQDDMKALEKWINQHVLSEHGIKDKTAHLDWEEFQNHACHSEFCNKEGLNTDDLKSATFQMQRRIHCYESAREPLTHDHAHGLEGIEEEAFGFAAGRSNQTWNGSGYDAVEPKFVQCGTFQVSGLRQCNEWHADNRYICVNYGDEIDGELGSLSGTVHMGFEEEPMDEAAAIQMAMEWVNRRALKFGRGHSIDDMTVAKIEGNHFTQQCNDDFCNDADSDSMDKEVQLVLNGPSCFVTRIDDALEPSHSHGQDVSEGTVEFYASQKRPYKACVTLHVEHLDECSKWKGTEGEQQHECGASTHDNSGDHDHDHGKKLLEEHEEGDHDHDHGDDSEHDDSHGDEHGHTVEGYLHMGFHHEPTEEDMERLEVWFNKHVLHAHGVMHKTAHFDWSTFKDNMCMSSGDEACNREFSDSNFKLNTAAISAEAEENKKKNARDVTFSFAMNSEKAEELRNFEGAAFKAFKDNTESILKNAMDRVGAEVTLKRLGGIDVPTSRRSLLQTTVSGDYTFTGITSDTSGAIDSVIEAASNENSDLFKTFQSSIDGIEGMSVEDSACAQWINWALMLATICGALMLA